MVTIACPQAQEIELSAVERSVRVALRTERGPFGVQAV